MDLMALSTFKYKFHITYYFANFIFACKPTNEQGKGVDYL